MIPSLADNHPYTVVEASLIPGLNLIACRGGGVPEILRGAERQLCDPLPEDLADKIAERVHAPLAPPNSPATTAALQTKSGLSSIAKPLASAQSPQPRALPDRKLSVDVCVTYFQKAAYLGQLMDALEQQTETDFHVIAVNDGSPDAESNRVFEEQAARARSRGWDFYRQENAFVDAARNSAARRGTGDLILFIDSDDVPARNAMARMREAITFSGDDALICASYLFAGEKPPFDPATGEVLVPADRDLHSAGYGPGRRMVDPCGVWRVHVHHPAERFREGRRIPGTQRRGPRGLGVLCSPCSGRIQASMCYPSCCSSTGKSRAVWLARFPLNPPEGGCSMPTKIPCAQ